MIRLTEYPTDVFNEARLNIAIAHNLETIIGRRFGRCYGVVICKRSYYHSPIIIWVTNDDGNWHQWHVMRHDCAWLPEILALGHWAEDFIHEFTTSRKAVFLEDTTNEDSKENS